MGLKAFLWDNLLAIVFNIAGIIAAAVFTGLSASAAIAAIIASAWTAAMVLYFGISYILLRRRIVKIKKAADETADKFLLSEVVESPHGSSDSLYYELMVMQGRAAIGRVACAEREKAEYYDFLQNWVHEIKTPIAAITLICSNNKGEAFKQIARQAVKINNYAEQVLHAARTGNAEKDMLIRKTELSAVIGDCLKENKQLFIDSGVRVDVSASGAVYTDEKWLGFMLKQILFNCLQYARPKGAEIKITTAELSGGKLELSIRDNGIGILESELPRIFEKGFTGSNGRRNKRATGFGLYLCKSMADAMHINLSAESVYGQYTRISLIFNR